MLHFYMFDGKKLPAFRGLNLEGGRCIEMSEYRTVRDRVAGEMRLRNGPKSACWAGVGFAREVGAVVSVRGLQEGM